MAYWQIYMTMTTADLLGDDGYHPSKTVLTWETPPFSYNEWKNWKETKKSKALYIVEIIILRYIIIIQIIVNLTFVIIVGMFLIIVYFQMCLFCDLWQSLFK